MFFAIRKKDILRAAALGLCLLGLSVILWQGRAQVETFSVTDAGENAHRVVVIDPGHGGEDGGAVGADGTVESTVNLAVSLRLEALFAFLGQETVLTRSDDASIHTEGGTMHQRKVSDLKNRVALVNETQGAVLVSVHQNFLPGAPRVHGAQVFYNSVDGSQALAQAVQDGLNLAVNPGNAKNCKKIPDTIFLMKNVTAPAILVECGFLSNVEETARLQTAAYQTRLAVCIAAGVRQHHAAPDTAQQPTE